MPEREHRRFAHEAAVSFRVGKRVHEGRTKNVSRGGLCAVIAEAIPTGTELDVDLVLVFDENSQSDPLRLPARVVWCTSVDQAFQVGIVFRGLDAQRTEHLTLFLRYLDDASAEPVQEQSSLDDRFR